MAGMAKAYAATKILTGPGDAYLNVAVPGTGARLTIAANANSELTPDSTANPNAKHLGLTTEGCTMKVANDIESFEADELTSPYKQQLTGDEATISGNMLQIEDTTLLEYMMPGATAGSGSGYEQVTFGGKTTISPFSVAVIGASAEDPTKAVVFQLYSVVNFGGLEYQLSRKTPSSSPFEFRGQSVASRAQGDQVGTWWRQV